MIEHLLMPLDRQFEDGFGVVASSFEEAAKNLAEANKSRPMGFGHMHLPIFFLYRHAIELYLKSMILIAHRRLKLPNAAGTYEPNPKIPVNGKERELHNTHDINALYAFFKKITADNRGPLMAMTGKHKTDWSNTPKELDDAVAFVGDTDMSSTFFRYPTTKDKAGDLAKSGYKAATFEEVVKEANEERVPGRPGGVTLLMKDDNDNIVEAFTLDRDPMPELKENLLTVAKYLSGASFGMRATLTEGF